jgi:hypothetical protein
MRILASEEKYFEYLHSLIRGATNCYISTFGVYAGILADGRDVTEYGGKYQNSVHELLDALAKINTKILVGLPPLIYCDWQKRCPDCEENHLARLKRVALTANHWPSIEWKILPRLHMKLVCVYKRSKPVGGIVGGRNLSNSKWQDLSISLQTSHVRKFKNHFMQIYHSADKVNCAKGDEERWAKIIANGLEA